MFHDGYRTFTRTGDNGFDDIAFSPDVDLNKLLSQISVGEIVVVEAKPRNPSITLGTINNLTPPPAEVSQMSPEWIEKTANELIKAGQTSGNIRQQRLGQLLIEHKAKIQKAIVAVNKETGEIIVQKLN